MLVADYALLYIAAFLTHGVEQATAERRFGRLGRRVSIGNQTTSTAVTPNAGTEPALVLPPSPVIEPGYVISSTSLQSLSVATTLLEVAKPPPSPQQTNSVGSPEYESTVGSSGTAISGVVLIPTVAAPPAPALTTALLPSVDSSASTSSATTSAHLLDDLTDNPRVIPGHVSSLFNVTATTGSGWNATTATTDSVLIFTTTPTPTESTDSLGDLCTPLTNTATITKWSIIYTSTTTWTGDPAEYTPPFPPISTPNECTSQVTPAPELPPTTGRLSVSICDGSGENCTPYTFPASAAQATGTAIQTGITTAADYTVGGVFQTPTLVFWTTDKNPAVVFSSSSPPNYGDDGSTLTVNHNTAINEGDSITTPQFGISTSTASGAGNPQISTGPGGKTSATSSSPGVTVIIQTTQVVINGQTITDNPQSKTSTIVIGTDTFVVDPTEVIGAGATLVRPVNIGGIFVSTPSTTTVAGLQVVYGPSVARIDGTVFTIGTTPTTAVVKGQTITVGPAGIAFATQTIAASQGSEPTEVAVLGGELITAIGSSEVVIEGSTITYGPGSSTVTRVVDDDTVLIGPSGIIVHNLTLGGTTAAPTATTYEIVGGATITEVGSTAVVVGGTTFFVGSGVTSQLTTVVGGATLTIGPGGVSMSTFTFAPYATTTGVQPGETSSIASATAKDAGLALRPNWELGVLGLCIAFGAGLFG